MAATQKLEVEQMRMVLQEMNNHPEARLFYALQERGSCIAGLDSESSKVCWCKIPLAQRDLHQRAHTVDITQNH